MGSVAKHYIHSSRVAAWVCCLLLACVAALYALPDSPQWRAWHLARLEQVVVLQLALVPILCTGCHTEQLQYTRESGLVRGSSASWWK